MKEREHLVLKFTTSDYDESITTLTVWCNNCYYSIEKQAIIIDSAMIEVCKFISIERV